MKNYFVITGGPGSGKTTLAEALQAQGMICMPEAGRAIIRDQMAIAGTALPWADRASFAEQMLGWEMRSHHEAGRHGKAPVVFDRGIIDVIGYLRHCGLPVPGHAARAASLFRYHPFVFVAPPWPAIYVQDAERRQDADEAAATCRAMEDAYRAHGYSPIALPLAPVAARIAFVRDHVARWQA
ncbi:AAA family ATPase [Niveispirillum fermenti]|uniref:AAA family ATPase n=1 Tax=Niveispirillum fermenti TaxID=1233113 RepID=UPI003A8894E3